ncbi:MAG: radical SAM protein [Methanobrevibacter sp.]|nr:radical SAM protein [Methanobrevibacter sp.]
MSWKILRILTTNSCNYRCVYCHNEGQSFSFAKKQLSLLQLKKIIQKITNTEIQEIRFSGGEPLSNNATIDMIEWVDKNTDYEVGLATNGSLVTEPLVIRLAKTRVMVTLHLPAMQSRNYYNVTGCDIQKLKKCIELFDKYNINYSFNYVLYPNTIDNLDDVINYSINHKKRIKLLPYIERDFKKFSSEIIKQINIKMKNFECVKKYDNINGITWWTFSNDAVIKMIDSPCYSRDIHKCRNYAEIRLLPDLNLQSCIFGDYSILDNVDDISKKMEELWDKFNACPKL